MNMEAVITFIRALFMALATGFIFLLAECKLWYKSAKFNVLMIDFKLRKRFRHQIGGSEYITFADDKTSKLRDEDYIPRNYIKITMALAEIPSGNTKVEYDLWYYIKYIEDIDPRDDVVEFNLYNFYSFAKLPDDCKFSVWWCMHMNGEYSTLKTIVINKNGSLYYLLDEAHEGVHKKVLFNKFEFDPKYCTNEDM